MAGDNGGADEPAGPSLSRFACIVPGFLIVVAIAVGGGLVFVNCLRASPSTSYTTRIDALPLETPIFLSGPGIYLVRLPDGVAALSQYELRRDPANPSCVIRWRETLERAGRRGFFRSDCTGALYALDGSPVDGAAEPMKRHRLMGKGETITVAFATCLSPGQGNAVVPCRPF